MIFAVALTAMTFGAAGAQCEADTVLSVKDANKVIITENALGLEIKVKGTSADSSYQSIYTVDYDPKARVTSRMSTMADFSGFKTVINGKPRSGEWSAMMGGLSFGFVNAVSAPASMDVEMGKSFELGILHLLAVGYTLPAGYTTFSVGMGLNWRNYKMTTSSTRFIPVDGQISTGAYPEGVSAKFSRLKIFSLMFPIMLHQQFPLKVPGGSRLSLSGGVILNYNGHSSLKTKWIDSQFNEVEEYCGEIGRRPFTVDFIGVLKLCSFAGVYVKYSPMDTLRGDLNPAFHTFSTGVTFFW